MLTTIIIFVCSLVSCNNEQQDIEFKEFLDCEIQIPNTDMFTMNRMVYSRKAIMLVKFFDEGSCRDCVLKEIALNDLYNIDSCSDVGWLYIFETPSDNVKRFYNQVLDAGIRGVVYLDTCKAFVKANPKFPSNKLFHTFVINDEGKVLMVGNPFANEKMEALFKKVIAKERKKHKEIKKSV